jgi:hypothetical protein
MNTGQSRGGEQLGKAALGLTAFQRNAVQQQLGSGDAKQKSTLARLGQGLLQFVPGDFELGFRAFVIEAVEPNVFNQNIETVYEGAGRRAPTVLTWRCGEDRVLLTHNLPSQPKAKR